MPSRHTLLDAVHPPRKGYVLRCTRRVYLIGRIGFFKNRTSSWILIQ